MRTLFAFVQQAFSELVHKVSWPSQQEVNSKATRFLVACLIFTLLLGGINIGWQRLIQWIYARF